MSPYPGEEASRPTMTAEANRGYAKGRARQREILEKAVALFGESGYRGTSLREIAARCGVSHPGLKYHFPTKEALLLAVLEQRDEDDSARMAADDPVGVEGLRRLVEIAALNADRRVVVDLFTSLAAEATTPDHPAHSFFAERYRKVIAATTAAYEHARGQGHLVAGVDPATAARQLLALMDGLQVQWLYDPATDMAGTLRAHIQRQLTVPL